MTEDKFELEIGGKVIVFDRPIEQILQVEGNTLVRFETADNIFSTRHTHKVKKDSNILCFDQKGNLIWEIDEAPKLDSLGGPYGELHFNGGKLITYHQMGCEFEIDPSSGKVRLIPRGRPW